MSLYARNLTVAINRAAKVTGISADDIRANYNNVNEAPKGVKRACILAHRIMNGYKAVETAPAVEVEA